MTTKKENLKQEETSQGTLPGEFQAPLSTLGTHGNPNQGFTIIQNFHYPSLPSKDKQCSPCEKKSIPVVLEVLVQFGKLTPEDQKIVLEMVKDSSITSKIPGISSIVTGVLLGMVKDSSITKTLG